MAAPQYSNWSRGQDFFRDLPVTKTVIAIWVLGFLLTMFRVPLGAVLAFSPSFPNLMTGLVTYPLLTPYPALFSLLISGLMLYWFGGSLERSWGWRTYLLFLLGASVAALVVLQLGFLLIGVGMQPFSDPWLMISATIVAWARLNPEQTILLWFVLPIKAKWIGWLTIAFLFIGYSASLDVPGALGPLIGIFALGGAAFAFAFVWYQRTWAWIPRRRASRKARNVIRHPASGPFGAVTRPFREWQRRRRVAKLQRTFHLDD